MGTNLEKKLTDEKLEKGLEQMLLPKYRNVEFWEISSEQVKGYYDLIHRLQSENRDLTGIIDCYKKTELILQKEIAEKREEIELLTKVYASSRRKQTKKELLGTIAEYERKLEDGELVSKEWHDEQIGHAELVIEEQKAEIERMTEEKADLKELLYIERVYRKQAHDKADYLVEENKKKDDIIHTATNDYCELQKQVDKQKEEIKQQAVKDTAKEIFMELLKDKNIMVDENGDRWIPVTTIKELAISKGVEVE